MVSKIAFFSHTYKNHSLFKVGSHHLANVFSNMGIEVDYFSTPISLPHFFIKNRKTSDKLFIYHQKEHRIINDNITEYSIMSYIPYVWGAENYKLYSFMCNRFFESNFGRIKTDLLLIDQPIMMGLIKFFDCKKIIYRPTDIYSLAISDKFVESLETDLLKIVDAAICTSLPVKEHIDKLCSKKIKNIVIENGVDVECFLEEKQCPKELNCLKDRPILIYVGALDHRFDFELLYEVAKELPEMWFVIVGPFYKLDKLLKEKLRNLIFIGEIEYENISGFLQHSSIGIMPFKKNLLNDGRSPMKFYEYTAARLPIVATSLLEMERRKYNHIFFSNNKEEFIYRINEALRFKADKSYYENIINQHDWRKKGTEILEYIGKI